MDRKKFSPFNNLADLPEELKKELKVGDDAESKIVQILEEGGGMLNISELLVGYYKMFKEVKKRAYMSSVLYRMSKKGLVYATGKKGEYSTNEEDAANKSSDMGGEEGDEE